MEEQIRKEVEALKGMVLSWKKDYLQGAPPGGGGAFLAGEFLEEIDTHVYPYAKRMYECDYLSPSEAKELLEFCYNQVEELRELFKETEH